MHSSSFNPSGISIVWVIYISTINNITIIFHKNTKILVQGFTGSQATLHSEQSIEYGTNIVGGVTPSKGGQTHLDIPVFNSVHEAVESVQPNASIIFVPAPFCKDSILEAADAGIKLKICITEGVPTFDMLIVKKRIDTIEDMSSEEVETLVNIIRSLGKQDRDKK